MAIKYGKYNLQKMDPSLEGQQLVGLQRSAMKETKLHKTKNINQIAPKYAAIGF